MTLIECPDCGRQVSSAAAACPACGYPVYQVAAPPASVSPMSPVGRSTALPLSFGLTGTVSGFLWATSAGLLVAAIAQFGAFGNWLMWMDGEVGFLEFRDIELVADMFLGLAMIGFLITSVLFIVWFFKAYKSAESRGAQGMRWGAGWTVGSWFIPIAGWVIPKLVMNEVDRMSNPGAGEPPIEQRWEPLRRLVASDLWWAAFVLAISVHSISWVVTATIEFVDDATYGASLFLASAWTLAYAISGVLLGVTTLKIGKRLRP